jgi:hypothetical protein
MRVAGVGVSFAVPVLSLEWAPRGRRGRPPRPPCSHHATAYRCWDCCTRPQPTRPWPEGSGLLGMGAAGFSLVSLLGCVLLPDSRARVTRGSAAPSRPGARRWARRSSPRRRRSAPRAAVCLPVGFCPPLLAVLWLSLHGFSPVGFYPPPLAVLCVLLVGKFCRMVFVVCSCYQRGSVLHCFELCRIVRCVMRRAM